MKTKEFNIALIFILTSLGVYVFFPADGIFQQIITAFVFFAILPLLFNKFILKNSGEVFGFNFANYKQGVLWSAYSLIAVGFIIFISSYFFGFLSKYSVPVFIIGDFSKFLFYEFVLVVPFVFLYEFYFRGFLMPILSAKFGFWAILIQALVFLILVLSDNGGSIVQFAPYFIFAPFAGLIAYKSKSIFYSGLTQFIIILVLNIISIKRVG